MLAKLQHMECKASMMHRVHSSAALPCLKTVTTMVLLAIAVCTVPLQPTLLLMISANTSAVAVAVTGSHKADCMAAAAAVALPASKAALA